jgi:hypothetical protein
VRANTGRATTTIMIATTAHLVGSQSARKRTANPPAVPRDYAIKSHLALPRSPRRATNPLPRFRRSSHNRPHLVAQPSPAAGSNLPKSVTWKYRISSRALFRNTQFMAKKQEHVPHQLVNISTSISTVT